MAQPGWILVFAAFVAAATACTALPEYAAPKLVAFDEENIPTDGVTYRPLKRLDFQGWRPPAGFDERMAAVTCAYIEPIIDRDALTVHEAVMQDGTRGYHVTFNNLRFRAFMDRNCSWWNTANTEEDIEYILEHEQIHFALFEVAARQWSADPPIQLRIKAGSREAMKDKMREQFAAQMDEKMSVLMEQNRKFDEETSLGYNIKKQKKWLEKVNAQLEKTPSLFGSGPEEPDQAEAMPSRPDDLGVE